MNYYDIGEMREIRVDRGLFHVSKAYRKWVEELIDTPFESDLKDIQEKLKKIEDFWTKGKASAFYGFSDFVMEMKDKGVVTSPGPRSCVLSGLMSHAIWSGDLEEQARSLDDVMRKIPGLNTYTIRTGGVYYVSVDSDEYPCMKLTMVKRKESVQ